MAAAAGVARYALAIVIAALLPLPLLSEKFTGDGTAYSGAWGVGWLAAPEPWHGMLLHERRPFGQSRMIG